VRHADGVQRDIDAAGPRRNLRGVPLDLLLVQRIDLGMTGHHHPGAFGGERARDRAADRAAAVDHCRPVLEQHAVPFSS
jgi:hypothetical protein